MLCGVLCRDGTKKGPTVSSVCSDASVNRGTISKLGTQEVNESFIPELL